MGVFKGGFKKNKKKDVVKDTRDGAATNCDDMTNNNG